MKEKTVNPGNACETTLSGGGVLTKYLKHNDFDPVLKKHIFNFGQKKSAFTLAETMIVVAILGLIAVLTVPNLVNKNVES